MLDARKPVIPLAIENDEDHVLIQENGMVRAAANVILSEHDVGRIRAGYVCANCFEVHDMPFPKTCFLCGFPMADKQAEYFAKAYQGNVRMGPSTSDEDELAAIQELEDRQKFEQNGGRPKPQIWLPRGV